ncbi:gibberellin 20 oxidase 1-A [Physcomitrium patens]|uniref:Fe2OG dioxygenase domain-containing protein n=1 Tax=Physcomitrium patens TaxID=3218 RepID=A0A7I4FLG3_PHYPA|nr:gibberellin 20 oxidase 1-A-like [Physcomitrium patens]|eukprot:XP_024359558.1 gibberellin 20 oxidase 1-A-like [Physcomitrella patens]
MPDRSLASHSDVGVQRLPKSLHGSGAALKLTGPWSLVNNCSSKGSTVSEKFVLPEHQRPTLKHDEYTDLEIPVIDVAAINNSLEGDATAKEALVAQVREACLNWGCFQIVNHDISEELLSRIQYHVNRFFNLPFAEKMKVVKQDGSVAGYGHATVKNGDVRPSSERFFFANDGSVAENAQKLWSNWDENDFIGSYSEYYEKVHQLSGSLIRIIVQGLEVDPVHFEKYWKNTSGLLLWNFYPACPEPQKAIGINAHTDFNLLTVLHENNVGGLQIEKDGEWVAVRPRPGALAVNIGDTLQVLTNAKYRSVPHRAVVNETQTRISVAYFHVPVQGIDIVPHPELVDEHNPNKYEPFTIDTYTKIKQAQTLNTLELFLRTDTRDNGVVTIEAQSHTT